MRFVLFVYFVCIFVFPMLVGISTHLRFSSITINFWCMNTSLPLRCLGERGIKTRMSLLGRDNSARVRCMLRAA